MRAPEQGEGGKCSWSGDGTGGTSRPCAVGLGLRWAWVCSGTACVVPSAQVLSPHSGSSTCSSGQGFGAFVHETEIFTAGLGLGSCFGPSFHRIPAFRVRDFFFFNLLLLKEFSTNTDDTNK